LAALFALTIGIGATAAMYTVVSGVLFRPLPVQNAARLVQINEIDSRTRSDLKVSMTDFADWKTRLRSFSAMALYRVSQGNLTGMGSPKRVRTFECDSALLPLLGIAPIRGRGFSEEQTQAGRASEALLTWAFWQTEFGGQDVIGRQLVIDEKPYTVVGVLPNLLMMFGEQNVWLPLDLDLTKRENGRGYHWYYALGRLRPGVSLHEANEELRTVAAALATEYPLRNEAVSAHARQLRETIIGDYRSALLLLFGLVAAVLLIACVNVASLSLTRASARQREMSIRVAIGANRMQLFRQMLAESLLLSCTATVAGVVMAIVLVRLITRLSLLSIPLSQNIQVDWRVLLFCAGTALLTGVGFGLAPALRASIVQAGESLKQSTTRSTETRSQRNLKRSFVFLQSALAALLLVFSGLLLRSFLNASQIDPGFDVSHLLTLHVSLPASRLDFEHPGKVGVFVRSVLARIRGIPGIEDAAIASDVPLTVTGGAAGVLVEGKPQPKSPFSAPYAQWTLVSPGYFRALRIPLLRGRDFDEHDHQGTPSVAIVNQAFVTHFLDGRDAGAKRIALASDPSHYLQIVGVVGDVHQLGMEKETIPQVFFSLNQLEDSWLAIVVRTEDDPIRYVMPIRSAVQKVDPEIAVFLPKTMQQIISQQRGWRVFETSLVGAFAGIAILLAALGTYAVISYSIAQRIPEIGIRMALGATRANILNNFILEGAMPAVMGTELGLILGFGVAKASASLLYGVTPSDVFSYAATVLILLTVAFLASYFPARRASSLEPSRALRYE
jgi:putative ABC transport system permease protein